jgi:D-arabinose 1-dehydrogenase-like Zn-dependent alcohol dehydrogenase
VGEGVTTIEVGKRVVPYLFATCGHCIYCRTGRDSLCGNLTGMLGVRSNGGFAEYFVAPSRNLFELPDNVPFETGGLASCAVITALHALRRSRIRLGETSVVVGAGGVAQPLIQLLKAAGIRVVAVSRSKEKLDIAQGLGADLVITAGSEDMGTRVAEFTGDEGPACVYDCVGSSATMRDSADLVRRGGQIIVLGEEPEYPGIDSTQLAQRELEIIGSRNGSRQDFADAVAMLGSGIVTPPIARTFQLEEINNAFEFVREGQAHARVVVTL